jgi:hypothetical protein
MANIPVEKKSGFPWWLILLAVLLLALLAWFLLDNDDEIVDDYDDEIVNVEPVEPIQSTGVITSWAELQNVAARENLIGRQINIDNLVATRVSGDSTFFVAPDRNTPDRDRLFVVLEDLGESETGAMGRDGEYNVDVMEEMTLRGEVVRLMDSDPDAWMLDETDAEMVRSGNVYVRASNLMFTREAGGMDNMDNM